jgi:hypothetical protein
MKQSDTGPSNINKTTEHLTDLVFGFQEIMQSNELPRVKLAVIKELVLPMSNAALSVLKATQDLESQEEAA